MHKKMLVSGIITAASSSQQQLPRPMQVPLRHTHHHYLRTEPLRRVHGWRDRDCG